jgi:hypothetical protein
MGRISPPRNVFNRYAKWDPEFVPLAARISHLPAGTYLWADRFERLINQACSWSRQVVIIEAEATLAQLVERPIRNFHVSGYAIDSTVGYRVVPSVHSASRALIESDFESNFRVARGLSPSKPANSKSAEFDLGWKPGYSESICLLSFRS